MISERASRWFDRVTGELLETYPLKKPVKNEDGTMRTTTKFTLKHARLVGALPSVTFVIKETLNPGYGLADYWNNCMLKAAAAMPFKGEPGNQADFDEWANAVVAEASKHREQAADEGTAIHAAVAQYVEQQLIPPDPLHQKVCEQFDAWYKQQGITRIGTEERIVNQKYGIALATDQMCYAPNRRIILDIKSVADIGKFTAPYDSWMFQEGGYEAGTESEPGTELWQAVVCRKTGEVDFIRHENDGEKWKKGFLHLYEVFVLVQGYDPRTWKGA